MQRKEGNRAQVGDKQWKEEELSSQMGGGCSAQDPLNTLTCHLNCFNCQSYRPIRCGSLSSGPGNETVGRGT